MDNSNKENVDPVTKQHKEIKQHLYNFFKPFHDECLNIPYTFLIKKAREIAHKLGYAELDFSSKKTEHKFLDNWKRTYFPENTYCFSYGPEIIDIQELGSKWFETGEYSAFILTRVIGRYNYNPKYCGPGFPRTWDEWTSTKSYLFPRIDFRKVGTMEFVMKSSEKIDSVNQGGIEMEMQEQEQQQKPKMKPPVTTRSKSVAAAPTRAPSERLLKRRKLKDGTSSSVGDPSTGVGTGDDDLDLESQMDALEGPSTPEDLPPPPAAPEIVVRERIVDDQVPGTSAECRRLLAKAQRNPLYPIDTNVGNGAGVGAVQASGTVGSFVPLFDGNRGGQGSGTSGSLVPQIDGNGIQLGSTVKPKPKRGRKKKKSKKENKPVANIGPRRYPLKHGGKSIPDIRYYNATMELEIAKDLAAAVAKAAEEKLAREAAELEAAKLESAKLEAAKLEAAKLESAKLEAAELEADLLATAARGVAPEEQNPSAVDLMDGIEVGRGIPLSPSSMFSGFSDISYILSNDEYETIFNDPSLLFSSLSLSPSAPAPDRPQETPPQETYIPPPSSSVIFVEEIRYVDSEEQRSLMPPPVPDLRIPSHPSTITVIDIDDEEEVVKID